MEDGREVKRTFCEVEIFEEMSGKRIQSFPYPRWPKNPKPGYHDNPRDHFPDDWNYRDIPPTGDKEQIEFAIKGINEKEMFGFTGRSQIGNIKWKRQDLKILLGRCHVKITVSGAGMSKPAVQWLKVENQGAGRSLQVEKMSKAPPPWVFL